jgi:hypothetical protein
MVDNRVAAFRQQGTEDLLIGYLMNEFFFFHGGVTCDKVVG